MTIWDDHNVEARVVEILEEIPTKPTPHIFGRPFISGYQLAVELHRRYPELALALVRQVGGVGIGERNSLAQYLAQQLSSRIGRDPDGYPVEGVFLSNMGVSSFTFIATDGEEITSSLTGSGFDLALFRLRG